MAHPLLDRLLRLARGMFDGPTPPSSLPDDPYAGVREPRFRTPGGRSSAIAVAEPEPERLLRAVSGRRDRAADFD